MFSKANITLICLIFLTSSCALMNHVAYKGACTKNNWESVGYKDGASGKSVSSVSTWNNRCSQFDVTPDANAYRVGHKKGIVEYCRKSGYRQGMSVNASSKPSLCLTKTLSDTFNTALTQGRKEYCVYNTGLKLGKEGTPSVNECEKYRDFNSGYKKGLAQYCTVDKAYTSGLEGKEFNFNSCKANTSILNKDYEEGKYVASLKQDQEEAEELLANYKNKLQEYQLPADIRDDYSRMVYEQEQKLKSIGRELYKFER